MFEGLTYRRISPQLPHPSHQVKVINLSPRNTPSFVQSPVSLLRFSEIMCPHVETYFVYVPPTSCLRNQLLLQPPPLQSHFCPGQRHNVIYFTYQCRCHRLLLFPKISVEKFHIRTTFFRQGLVPEKLLDLRLLKFRNNM